FRDIDYIVGALGIVLVLEATRRCVGLPIVIIALSAIGYSILIVGQSWQNYVVGTFFTARSGIFGTPIQVSSTFIFLFLLFAVVLIRTNIGVFFNDLAFRLAGRYTGGPAKAAVAASGLQGMISGSSVANTVASGSFTIPIVKKAGFKPHVAGATEATASTGGQLMPPIMGAAAFIMAEYTGIPYSEIIVIAIIPAALYFLGVFLSVHFDAKRNGGKGLPVTALPSWMSLIRRADLILPLVAIVWMLLDASPPARPAELRAQLPPPVLHRHRHDPRGRCPHRAARDRGLRHRGHRRRHRDQHGPGRQAGTLGDRHRPGQLPTGAADDHAGLPGAGYGTADHRQLCGHRDRRRADPLQQFRRPADRRAHVRVLLRDPGRHHPAGVPGRLCRIRDRELEPAAHRGDGHQAGHRGLPHPLRVRPR